VKVDVDLYSASS